MGQRERVMRPIHPPTPSGNTSNATFMSNKPSTMNVPQNVCNINNSTTVNTPVVRNRSVMNENTFTSTPPLPPQPMHSTAGESDETSMEEASQEQWFRRKPKRRYFN